MIAPFYFALGDRARPSLKKYIFIYLKEKSGLEGKEVGYGNPHVTREKEQVGEESVTYSSVLLERGPNPDPREGS